MSNHSGSCPPPQYAARGRHITRARRANIERKNRLYETHGTPTVPLGMRLGPAQYFGPPIGFTGNNIFGAGSTGLTGAGEGVGGERIGKKETQTHWMDDATVPDMVPSEGTVSEPATGTVGPTTEDSGAEMPTLAERGEAEVETGEIAESRNAASTRRDRAEYLARTYRVYPTTSLAEPPYERDSRKPKAPYDF
ncbi:hypothetical protein EUX98_g6303, partial [Antrodiella citrinella]